MQNLVPHGQRVLSFAVVPLRSFPRPFYFLHKSGYWKKWDGRNILRMMRTTFPSRRMSSKSSKLNQSRYVLQPFSLSLLMHKRSCCNSQGCWRRQLKGDGSAVHGSVIGAVCVRWWVLTLSTPLLVLKLAFMPTAKKKRIWEERISSGPRLQPVVPLEKHF